MGVNNQKVCSQVKKFTGIIMLLLLHVSHPVVIYVDTCPNNTESWVERSGKFLCKDPNEVYHCIQSISGHLIETCMKGYVIKSYKVDCPWVRIHNRTSHLHYPFLRCDTKKHGCPKLFHNKYSTNELYLYPACIDIGGKTTFKRRYSVKEKTRTTFDSTEIHKADTVTEKPKTYDYIVLISIGLFIFGLFLGGMILQLYLCLCRVIPAPFREQQTCASDGNYNLSEFVSSNKTEKPCQSSHTNQEEYLITEENRNTEPNDHASQKTIRARKVNSGSTAQQELLDNAESYTDVIS